MIHYGCQCDVFGAPSPGVGPGWWHKTLRWVYEFFWTDDNGS